MTRPFPTSRLLDDIEVTVSVELGRAEMPLKDVVALGEDSVVPLDRLTDELLDVMVNGHVIAKAEIVANDGKFAFRIVEMVGKAEQPHDAPSQPFAGPDAVTTNPVPDMKPGQQA